jgi:uncharacterized protein YcbX
MARVVALVHYPIKACAGTPVSTAEVTEAGLAHDRSFMVIGTDGTYRNQKRDPLLATVRPQLTSDGAELNLRAPGMEPMTLQVDTCSPRRPVTVFTTSCRGIDQGEQAAEWLSTVVGAPSRLVRVPPEHDRVTGGETPGTAGFADAAALLVTAQASLNTLNRRIAERGGAPLPMARFRPNIVLDGWRAAHVEDQARRIEVGSAELGFAEVAVRCAVTTVDQESGERAGPEPLRTLAGYRRGAEGGVLFGVRFAVCRAGTVSVGDEAAVRSWAAP